MNTLMLICILGAFLPFGSARGFETESVVYARPEGKELKGTLYLPRNGNEEMRPAVVLIHGGAWLTGSRRQLYWYGRRLAEHGYVALTISYRTMPGAPFPAQVHDGKAAVRWLRSRAEDLRVNPERIGALGTSAGGHVALMLAFTKPEDGLEGTENPGWPSDVQAVVSLYGPTDLTRFKQSEKKWSTDIFWGPYVRSYVGKAAPAGVDPMAAASPITYVDADAPPVLLVHGTDDKLVPLEQSEELLERLEQAGCTASLIRVPKHSHSFDHIFPTARRRVFRQVLEFLDTHLKGA